jgi:hypothetical protein
MRLGEEGIRSLISAALVALMMVMAVRLWSIDLLSKQEEFALFLGSELAAFSMLLYLYTRSSYGDVKKAWMLAGCLALVFFLTLAILQ